MKKIIIAAILFTTAFLQAAKAEELGISAIVDERVITTKDVNARLEFVAATSGLPDNDEARTRFRPQVLRQLVDESLQLQEASRFGISVDDSEIEQAIALIEKQRNLPAGGLLEGLKQKGANVEEFKNQLRPQIAWTKIITKKIRPNLKVSEEEIERSRLQLASNPASAFEYLINLLSLSVDSPQQDADTKKLAEHISSELAKGVAFANVAQQLTPASPPPEPFWVGASDLDPEIANVLSVIQKGDTSNAIRTANGYIIVKLLDKRTSNEAINGINEIIAKLFTLSAKDGKIPSAEEFGEAAKIVAETPGNCDEDGYEEPTVPPVISVSASVLQQSFSDLSDSLKASVSSLAVGAISAPIPTENGLQMVLLCERIDVPPELAAKDKTYARLMSDKLEQETKKYLRNLRRDAFVEIKQ